MRFVITLLLLIALAGAGYYIYGHFAGPGGPGGPPGGAAPVSVAEVVVRNVRQWSEFSGRLVAVNQADIRPQVAGTITQVAFKNGALVKKGELLFVIDPRPYEAAMQSASARANLANAELQRAESLLKDKAIAQKDYDQRKNDAEVAKADLATAALNLDYTRVKSPIAGRVGRAELTVGNLVNVGEPMLTTVVSNTPIYADFEIDDKTYLQYASTGNTHDIPVQLELDGSVITKEGRVESFDNRLNTASGTLRVRSVFDNADGTLVPGLFARIKLGTAGEKSSILITDRAIGTDQNKKFVYVVAEDGMTSYREIKLGAMADGLRVVNEGLQAGEKIVVNGLQRVRPGTPVVPEMVPMEGQVSGAGNQVSEEKETP